LRSAAEITARVVYRDAAEQVFLLVAGSEAAAVRTRMFGSRHVTDCLLAAAVGLAYGIDLMTVVQGLEAVDYVPGRLRPIECGQSFGVFVDGARTAGALAAALRTLREANGGRLICVFSAPAGTQTPLDAILRATVRLADVAILTTAGPRCQKRFFSQEVPSEFEGSDRLEIIPERARAIGAALSQAQARDVVLIAGRGDGPGADARPGREAPDDCDLARQWLLERMSEGEIRTSC
jgi:UDP-N-acetylmuramoyl-L-alanyl-D-glutamate--2,6-diaminopimelate ligase